MVALLCFYNNTVIDYAKTLYKPDLPDTVQKEIDDAIRYKVPHFFIYAKGKTKDKVEEKNDSTVNRLEAIVPNPRFKFKTREREKFNYKMLMRDSTVVASNEIIEAYDLIYKKHKHVFSSNAFADTDEFLKVESIKTLCVVTGDLTLSCDMLIQHLFSKSGSKRQNIFWLCFGDIVKENLESNLGKEIQCDKCGVRFFTDEPRRRLCKKCNTYQPIGTKVVKCVDCGVEFEVDARIQHMKI